MEAGNRRKSEVKRVRGEENPWRRAADRMTGSGVTDGRWQDWFRSSQEKKRSSALSVRALRATLYRVGKFEHGRNAAREKIGYRGEEFSREGSSPFPLSLYLCLSSRRCCSIPVPVSPSQITLTVNLDPSFFFNPSNFDLDEFCPSKDHAGISAFHGWIHCRRSSRRGFLISRTSGLPLKQNVAAPLN